MDRGIRDLGHRPVGIADDLTSAMAKASTDIDIALVDVNLGSENSLPVAEACGCENVVEVQDKDTPEALEAAIASKKMPQADDDLLS